MKPVYTNSYDPYWPFPQYDGNNIPMMPGDGLPVGQVKDDPYDYFQALADDLGEALL